MPYENEHACRLRDPGDFKDGSFRRTTRKHDGKSEEPQDIERRVLPAQEIEMRVDDGDKPRLVGYAAKYGVFTDLGWFREKIKAGAFDDALIDADVRCLKNHDVNLILGRTKSGTLRLESNKVGLRFDDDVPDTTTGKDALEEVRRGDISGCSFSFTVAEQNWKYFEDDAPPERTIIKVGRLFDVGPVTFPAYPDTTVAARSLEAARQAAGPSQEEPAESDSPQASGEPAAPAAAAGPDTVRNEVSPDRQRQIERESRRMRRIVKRCRSAEV